MELVMNSESLLASIRAAIADGAPDDARAAGAHACRTLLGVLDAQPNAPIAAPASPIATTVAALRGLPADQLLDLMIAKLRTLVPVDAASPSQSFKLAFPTARVPTP
jgi:hypothetical protein